MDSQSVYSLDTESIHTTTQPETSIKALGFQINISVDKNKWHRSRMEDAHSYKFDYNGVPRQGFFAIFDGHNGSKAADWCGENFDRILSKVIEDSDKEKPVLEILNDAFLKVDEGVLELPVNSGCTAIVAFVRVVDDKRILYTGNVGDARAVLCHSNTATRLSYDHKSTDSDEIKLVEKRGGFIMNGRVLNQLAVTRSLGDKALKEFVVGNPYTSEVELDDDDFLILACDGLWDVCEDEKALEIVQEAQKAKEDPSRKLLKYALGNGSDDNISVMVIQFK